MPYDLFVHASWQRLPDAGELAALLERADRWLRVADLPRPRELRGFVDVVFDGTDTGFDVAVIASGATSDVHFKLTCRDVIHIIVARIFARTLARASGGTFNDPQTGELERMG